MQNRKKNTKKVTIRIALFIIALLVIVCGIYVVKNLRCRVVTHMEGDEVVATLKEGFLQKKEKMSFVIIPEGVTVVGNGAFKNCTSLVDILLPESLKEIGEEAFSGCTKVSAVRIPGNTAAIDAMAFEGCSSLASVTMLYNLRSIGDSSFANCNIGSVTVPDTVRYLGKDIFLHNPLYEITVPYDYVGDSLKDNTGIDIDNITVYAGTVDCPSVFGSGNMTDPESKIEMEGYSDKTKDSMYEYNTIIAEDDNKKHEALIYRYMGNEYYLYLDDRYAVVHSGTNGVIPKAVKYENVEYTVTDIKETAFKGSDITDLYLPKYVKRIDASAFEDCKELQYVNVPMTLYSIGEKAFYNCISLKRLTLQYGIRYIYSDAFSGVQTLYVPSDVVLYEGNSLRGVERIYIPSGFDFDSDIDYFGSGEAENKLKMLYVPNYLTASAQGYLTKISSKNNTINNVTVEGY